MRVLFISKSYPTNGGVERWLSDLCYGLPVHGIRPVLCLVKGNTYHKPSKYLQVYPEIRSVETHIADGTLGSKSARIKSLKNIIKTVAPDVVVPVLLHEAIQAADTRRRRGQKLKIVYPVHENDVWVFDAVNEKKDYIDMLVCVNRLFVDVCERLLKIPKEKVRHVRCGARKPLNDQQKHNDVKIRIGYCGKLVESQKRFGDFIKICRTIFNFALPKIINLPCTSQVFRGAAYNIYNGNASKNLGSKGQPWEGLGKENDVNLIVFRDRKRIREIFDRIQDETGLPDFRYSSKQTRGEKSRGLGYLADVRKFYELMGVPWEAVSWEGTERRVNDERPDHKNRHLLPVLGKADDGNPKPDNGVQRTGIPDSERTLPGLQPERGNQRADGAVYATGF